MNETMQIIKKRRSIRNYRTEGIEQSILQEVLEAGLRAPMGMNQRCRHFTVVETKEAMDGLIRLVKQNIIDSGVEALAERAKNPAFNPFYGAPVLIILSAPENSKFAELDCGAAAQNMAIAAEALGLGACMIASSSFMASTNVEQQGRFVIEYGIPEQYVPVISVALGYRGEQPGEREVDFAAVNYV